MTTTTGRMKTAAVTDEFDHAAGAYDRLVGANPGYHRDLRTSVRRLRLPDRGEGMRLLDLGCGTGASTAALLAAAPKARIVAVDASQGMLDAARAKDWDGDVVFHRARAEELSPAWAHERLGGPADAVLGAYLIRNVPDPDALLRSVLEMLRPGGRLALHEYSVADSPSARAVWTAVCWGVIIPPAGRWPGGRTCSATCGAVCWSSTAGGSCSRVCGQSGWSRWPAPPWRAGSTGSRTPSSVPVREAPGER